MVRIISCCVALSLLALPAAGETVSFKTSDKLTIKAEWLPPTGEKRGVLVLFHMYKSHRFAWKPLFAHAEKYGLGVLAVDLRGHGESRMQGKVDYGWKVNSRDAEVFRGMVHDAEAAMKWLKKKGHPADKVVMMGASVGCSVALNYLHANPKSKLAAAALLTPGKEYLGVPSMKHITAWGGRPLLLTTSQEESDKGANQLYKALPDKSKAVLFKLPQKKIHGTNMFGKVSGIEKRLAEWAAVQLGMRVGP